MSLQHSIFFSVKPFEFTYWGLGLLLAILNPYSLENIFILILAKGTSQIIILDMPWMEKILSFAIISSDALFTKFYKLQPFWKIAANDEITITPLHRNN